jgi:predicted PurR-regulated permease PerM
MTREGRAQPIDGTPPRDLHLWHYQAVRDLLLIALVAGLVWAGYALRAVTVPLLVALLLAYLFEPLVAWLVRRAHLSRKVAVGLLIATVGLAVAGALAIVVPVVVGQTAGLVRDFEQGSFRKTALDLGNQLPEPWRDKVLTLVNYLPAPAEGAAPEPASTGPPRPLPAGVADGDAGARLMRGARAAAGVIGNVLQIGFLAFLIPFYFFFFSLWYPSIVNFGGGLVPSSRRARINELLSRMDRVVAAFVRGRIVISLVMGVLFAAGWWLCGVPYSVVLGLVIGLFCAVPYLGVVGVPLAIALLAFRELGQPAGEAMPWWGILLWPTVVYAIVQTVDGYVLTPLIAGKATNLDPVTILVAVLAGGSIMGVYGMLLGIPVAACVKIVFTDVMLPRIRAWSAGETSDPLPLRRR